MTIEKPQVEKIIGRPRILSLDAVLDAALELGVDKVSMKGLAERLGVAVGTLYRYVAGRDELLQRVAVRHRLQQNPFQDDGQSCEALVHEYAKIAFHYLLDNPALINLYIAGDIGPEAEVDFIEQFLGAMTRRGFEAKDALQLNFQIQMCAFSMAAHAHNVSALRNGERARGDRVHELFESRGDALTHIRSCAREFAREDSSQILQEQVQLLLTSFLNNVRPRLTSGLE